MTELTDEGLDKLCINWLVSRGFFKEVPVGMGFEYFNKVGVSNEGEKRVLVYMIEPEEEPTNEQG